MLYFCNNVKIVCQLCFDKNKSIHTDIFQSRASMWPLMLCENELILRSVWEEIKRMGNVGCFRNKRYNKKSCDVQGEWTLEGGLTASRTVHLAINVNIISCTDSPGGNN